MATTTEPVPRHLAPRPPLGPVRRAVREVGLALVTLGVVVLLFVAYQLWGTSIAESQSQATLANQFKQALAANHAGAGATPTSSLPAAVTTTTAAPAVVPPGGAIDHLQIPAIGVNKYVVEGTDEADLQRGPGHYTGTPYPGQDGNVAIAGHRTTYGAPFFDLNELKTGDPIYLTDLTGKTWRYDVSGPPQVVSPDDVAVLDATSFPQLTLTTCNPRFSATSRLVVVARLAGQGLEPSSTEPPGSTTPSTTAPATPAAPAGPPPGIHTLAGADNLGGGNSGAWLPVGLYAAAFLALWVLTRLGVHRTRRWAAAGLLAGGIVVCLVPLWFLFENVARLLPQSI